MRSILQNSFREFLAERKNIWLIALLAAGLALILLGGFGSSAGAEGPVGAEQRAAEMCSLMEGVGECRVMMTFYPEDDSRVYAVLVLCDGGDSLAVRERISSLFCSLYGIGAHRVEIQKLNK